MCDFTKGPLSVVEDDAWPFEIHIEDVNGVEVHTENRIAHSSHWKTLDDVYSAKSWPHDERDNVITLIARQMADIRLRAAAPDLYEVVAAMAKFDGRNNNAALKRMAKDALAKVPL